MLWCSPSENLCIRSWTLKTDCEYLSHTRNISSVSAWDGSNVCCRASDMMVVSTYAPYRAEEAAVSPKIQKKFMQFQSLLLAHPKDLSYLSPCQWECHTQASLDLWIHKQCDAEASAGGRLTPWLADFSHFDHTNTQKSGFWPPPPAWKSETYQSDLPPCKNSWWRSRRSAAN